MLYMFRLLAVCENPLEVQTIVPVARELEKQNESHVEVDFASQDPLLDQGADAALRAMGRSKQELPYPIHLSEPFHKLRTMEKLKVVLATDWRLRGVIDEYDGLMYGIDAFAAAMLAADAHRHGKPTFQIFASLNPGSAKEDSTIRHLKDTLRSAVGYLTGTRFLTYPNRPGGTPCDRLFVMGDQNKEVFIGQGIPRERVFAYGIPRFANLFEDGTEEPSLPLSDSGRILYVTGSFAWHGKMENHQLQQRQLRQIVKALQTHVVSDRPEFAVKVHPRESESYYEWMENLDVVTVISKSDDLYQCIRESTVVATIGSTVAYEAVFHDRVSIVTRFPDVDSNLFGKMTKHFIEVGTVEEFFEVVSTLHEKYNVYNDELRKQRNNAEKVIDPDSPRSAKLIAQNILNYLLKDEENYTN